MEHEDPLDGVVRSGTLPLRALAQELSDLGWDGETLDEADAAWEEGDPKWEGLSHRAVLKSLFQMAELGRRAAEGGEGCRVWRLKLLRMNMFFVGTEESVSARLMALLEKARAFARQCDEPDVFPDQGASFDDMAWAVARTALLADSRRERRRFQGMHGKAVQRCVGAVRTAEGWTALLRYPSGPGTQGSILAGDGHPSDWHALRDLFETIRLHGLPA